MYDGVGKNARLKRCKVGNEREHKFEFLQISDSSHLLVSHYLIVVKVAWIGVESKITHEMSDVT